MAVTISKAFRKAFDANIDNKGNDVLISKNSSMYFVYISRVHATHTYLGRFD